VYCASHDHRVVVVGAVVISVVAIIVVAIIVVVIIIIIAWPSRWCSCGKLFPCGAGDLPKETLEGVITVRGVPGGGSRRNLKLRCCTRRIRGASNYSQRATALWRTLTESSRIRANHRADDRTDRYRRRFRDIDCSFRLFALFRPIRRLRLFHECPQRGDSSRPIARNEQSRGSRVEKLAGNEESLS